MYPARALVGIAVLAALGLAGSSQAATAGGSPEISIRLKGPPLVYRSGDSKRLVGELRSHPGGVGLRRVELRGTPFPYTGKERVVRTTTTDAGGRFSFKLRPKLNTRYRVVAAAADSIASGRRTVYVFARVKFQYSTIATGVAGGSLNLIYSPEVRSDYLRGKRVFWYFRKLRQDRFRLVKTTRFRNRDRGHGVKAIVRYNLPRSRRGYRYQLAACTDAPPRDIGVGNKQPIRCSRHGFRAPRH